MALIERDCTIGRISVDAKLFDRMRIGYLRMMDMQPRRAWTMHHAEDQALLADQYIIDFVDQVIEENKEAGH